MNATAEKPEVKHYSPAQDAQGVFDKISQLLADAGHADPTAWQPEMVNMYGAQVTSEPAPVARVAANSYWRFVLGRVSARKGVDTSDARFCIEDACSEKEWYELFEKIVVPCIMKNAL